MSYRPYSSIQSSGVQDTRVNNSGSTINKGLPVKVNTTGDIELVDASTEADVLGIIGVTSQNIADGNSGLVANFGKIEDVSTTANLGDLLYLAKGGDLTNVKPSIGINGFVAGDFVVMVGVVARNETTPANKDLIVSISIVGQL